MWAALKPPNSDASTGSWHVQILLSPLHRQGPLELNKYRYPIPSTRVHGQMHLDTFGLARKIYSIRLSSFHGARLFISIHDEAEQENVNGLR